ncbi:MAG TPA: hypothetical protein VNF69_14510 [Burkholderiales bacterium]|nr:hypothetical protein [Burkholderiales bacterium]
MTTRDEANVLVWHVYARCLDAGTKLGFILLICSFVGYAIRITEPYVPLEQLPDLWRLSVAHYKQRGQSTRPPAGTG